MEAELQCVNVRRLATGSPGPEVAFGGGSNSVVGGWNLRRGRWVVRYEQIVILG